LSDWITRQQHLLQLSEICFQWLLSSYHLLSGKNPASSFSSLKGFSLSLSLSLLQNLYRKFAVSICIIKLDGTQKKLN
jgi:hypothetical protein